MDFTTRTSLKQSRRRFVHTRRSVKLRRKDLGGVAALPLMSTRRCRRCQACHANCRGGVHERGSGCHLGRREGTLVHAGVGRPPFVWPRSDRCGDTLTFLIDVNGLGTGRDVPLVR